MGSYNRVMQIVVIRHGESEGNVAATLQGCRLDLPLSPRGLRQAEMLAIRLAGENVDKVFSSPMVRARATAEVVAAPHGVSLVLDPSMVEFDWGDWTGRPLDEEMEGRVAELRARWRTGDTRVTAPGGESPEQAADRARGALARIRASGAQAPVVVAHGRFNRVLMSVLLGRPLSRMDEIKQRNGSLSSFTWDGTAPATPVLLDDIDHLPEELRVLVGGSDSVK